MSEIAEVLNEIVERHDCSHPVIVSKASAEITRLTAEVERKNAALKQAGTGLNAGLFQYAARDIHGNIVPGDEQYPWIRAMQIGLDAVTAALPPPPALSGDKPEQIPISDEVAEAAARAIIIANGGDPDAVLRLTINKTTIKAWQQVVPLARAALIAGLGAWPRMEIHTDGTEDWIELTLMQENNNGSD